MIDRRGEKIRCAGLKRAQSDLAFVVDGHHDDGNLGGAGQAAKSAHELRAIPMRHVIIGDDEIGRLVFERAEGLARI